MALLGAAALLLFGPDQLPKVMRKAGQVMREVQNTSHTFIREMERAAEVEPVGGPPSDAAYDPVGWQPIDEPAFEGAAAAEPAVAEKVAEPSPALEPPEPDPEPLSLSREPGHGPEHL